MGRAMLIISAGAVIALGIIQVGIQNQRKAITENSIVAASDMQIRNRAYTAAQLAMERINKSNGTWHPTKNSPWIESLQSDSISLYYLIHPTSSPGVGALSYLDEDTIEIHAKAWYKEPNTNSVKEINLISFYTKSALHFVPEFKSAMSFASDDFNITAGGSSTISGNDLSGECGNRPAITTVSEEKAQEVDNMVDSKHLISDSATVGYDPDLSYEPVDQLIARLANSEGTQYIQGNYKGSMGSETNPGVFFLEDDAKLTGGISEGYGILVVRNYGSLAYDSSGVELDIAGNFTFNGLVIFEDAYNLDGHGTPTINGSVLVGKKDENTNTILDVDISGNLSIQYDCTAEKFAQVASAKEVKQNRYKRLSTYE